MPKIERISLIEVSVLIVALVAFYAPAALSSTLAGGNTAVARVRREGFGPWEAQETWDNKGKPVVYDKIVQILDVIRKEEAIIANVTQAFFDEVVAVARHPVNELLKTRLGSLILLAAAVGSLVLLIRVGVPLFKGLWTVVCFVCGMFGRVLGYFCALIERMSCCMSLCAMMPLVKIRNGYRAWQLSREDKRRIQIYKGSGEEVELITRVTSRAFTDSDGVYLEAGNGKRVYLDKRHEAEDMIRLNFVAGPEREEGSPVKVVKETILSSSKLYKVDKVPEFQGQFEVEGTLVGHFSRIKFQNKDCILTAYHVLEYNRAGLISMTKGDKSVRMDSVRSRVLVASPSDDLDFVILEMPSFVFSTLGLKIGQWSSRAQPREPIMIYQCFEGKPCVSSASVAMSETKPWHIKYGASTISGTSGAPILNARSQIVGVHLEHDASLKCNVGVIPPVFRNCKKESNVGNDIAHAEDDLKEYDEDERDEEKEEEIEREIKEEMEIFRMIKVEYEDPINYYSKTKDWAMQMDEIEELVTTKLRSKYNDDSRQARIYQTPAGKTGSNIGSVIKRGRQRKESPWTCSKCYTIHKEKGYGCVNCGFALVKGKVAKKEKLDLTKQFASCPTLCRT
jgi:hypothetical protein